MFSEIILSNFKKHDKLFPLLYSNLINISEIVNRPYVKLKCLTFSLIEIIMMLDFKNIWIKHILRGHFRMLTR